MAIPGGALKDGMGSREIRVDTAIVDTISGGTLAVAAGEVGTDELADNAVTSAKLAVSYNIGHFTLGTNGAAVYTGFSGGGVAVSVGSPLTVNITPLAVATEPVAVTDYSPSGFTASGNAAIECMYQAFEEG